MIMSDSSPAVMQRIRNNADLYSHFELLMMRPCGWRASLAILALLRIANKPPFALVLHLVFLIGAYCLLNKKIVISTAQLTHSPFQFRVLQYEVVLPARTHPASVDYRLTRGRTYSRTGVFTT
jgi:hypothetical protein